MREIDRLVRLLPHLRPSQTKLVAVLLADGAGAGAARLTYPQLRDRTGLAEATVLQGMRDLVARRLGAKTVSPDGNIYAMLPLGPATM